MGEKTGNPRGRPKGAKNKRTEEREAAMKRKAAEIAASLGDAFDGDAHALLMAVYKDRTLPMKDRLAAATAAIGYEKPKLAAVEHSGGMDLTMQHEAALAELERKANGHGHELAQ